ncbi:MAG: serine hydrolase domain-containing protein [Vicinamibacterales bacterium]
MLLLFGASTFAKAEPDAIVMQVAIERLAREHHVCGVALAVIRNRALGAVHAASGCQGALEVTAESTFQAASLGKPAFAYAVLQMAEQGELSLDEPLTHYLHTEYVHRQSPYGVGPVPESNQALDVRLNQVTARMVLNHTSGLPNWSAHSLRVTAEPGAKWQYSGAGYVLLQRAIEAITEEPLDKFMDARLFKRAHMNRSAYVWNDRIAKAFVPGFAADGKAVETTPFTAPVAASSLYTSAADYARFIVVLLNDSPLLGRTIQAPVSADPGLMLSWGLGWGIERNDDELFIWHWGSNPGYRAFVVASVQTGDGFVMLTDSDDGLALAGPIAALIVPGAHRMFRFRMLNPSFPCRMLGLCS